MPALIQQARCAHKGPSRCLLPDRCAAPAGWLDVAHQFLGLTFPLSALFYIVSTLIFNRDWICGREVCVVVMVGLAGAARAGHARLHPEAQMLWPYSFTAYNGFWFGEAVVLVSIAWFTHFQVGAAQVDAGGGLSHLDAR